MPLHTTSTDAATVLPMRALWLVVGAVLLALVAPSSAAASTLFFTHTATPTVGGVGKVSFDGTDLNDALVTTSPAYAVGITATTTKVYYISENGTGPVVRINSANPDGTEAAVVHQPCTATSGGARPRVVNPALATDGQHLYYVCRDSSGLGTVSSIGRVGIDGTGANDDFILLGANVAEDLTVTATHAYFTTSSKVGRVALASGSTPTTIAVSSPEAIEVNSSHVFWAVGATIVRADFDLGNATTAVSGLAQDPEAVAATDSYLFWSSPDPGNGGRNRVSRSALDGSGLILDLVPSSSRGYIPGIAVASVAGGTTPATTSHAVTIEKKGTGAGTVSSSPAGIDCGATCTASFAGGTSVTLTATAAAGSAFSGWGGSCSGAAATCTVTVDAAKSATATFAAKPITITGSARVTSRGVTRVSVRVPAGGSVRLVGTRSSRSRAGTATVCTTAKRVERAGTVTLYCIPNRATRALLATRSVPVTLTVTYRSNAGTRVTDTVTATMPKREVAPPEPVTG